MLLSTGPRHELPADAAPQGSTDVFTSRLRDRVDALAVVLGQQAELALIDLLAPGQPPAASNTGAASNLPSQLQPCVAHVAASVATAFRHSSLKLLLPELHRLLEASGGSAAVQQLDVEQASHPQEGYAAHIVTPRTSAAATAPTTPDTSSAGMHSSPPLPTPAAQQHKEDSASRLPQLAPTWSQDDPSAAFCQGLGTAGLSTGGAPPGMDLQQDYTSGHSFGGASQHGPIGSPPPRHPDLGLAEQQQQQFRRISAGMFEHTPQQPSTHLLSHRRSLAGPSGNLGGMSDLAPHMAPNNPFAFVEGPSGTGARPRASCDVPVPPPPPPGPGPTPFSPLQRSSSEVPAHMFGRFDDGPPALSAMPAAFRGLTISSPPTQTRREEAWMGGYDKSQPPPPPTSGSHPAGAMDPVDMSEYNGSTAPGTDVSSGSNCNTPLSSETAAAAAMMAAVHQHLQQQQQQQHEQHAALLQQQLVLSGRSLSGQLGLGLAGVPDRGDDFLSMLNREMAGGSPPGYVGPGSAGTAQGRSALAMAHAWRMGAQQPPAADAMQPPGGPAAAPAAVGMGLLSASLAQVQQGQEQAQAQRLDALRMAPRVDASDVFPHSHSVPLASDGSMGSGSAAHSLPGTHSLSPFDHHGLPSLSELLLLSPASSATTAQRGTHPFAQGPTSGGPAGAAAATTLARCNSGSVVLRDSSSVSPPPQQQQQQQQQQVQSAFVAAAGVAAAAGGVATLQTQGPATHAAAAAASAPQQQYLTCGSASANAVMRSSHSGAVYAAASALARGMSCPTGEVPDVPCRFKVLPEVVQQRIMALTAANPVISVKDFDEKVVSKMSLLVDLHGTDEAMAMLLHLEHRMRTKQGVMKNGPGYLDVAVSSHLDMLKAQGSCPKNMTTEEYAAHTLSPVVLHELREAVHNSKWLQWSHLDQGIIQLIKKLPRDSAVEKLQEISYHSFKNVDNIKGCIMSILNSRIREDRRKQ